MRTALEMLDGPYSDFSNKEGFAEECAQGRDLGFDGKTLIHRARSRRATRSSPRRRKKAPKHALDCRGLRLAGKRRSRRDPARWTDGGAAAWPTWRSARSRSRMQSPRWDTDRSAACCLLSQREREISRRQNCLPPRHRGCRESAAGCRGPLGEMCKPMMAGIGDQRGKFVGSKNSAGSHARHRMMSSAARIVIRRNAARARSATPGPKIATRMSERRGEPPRQRRSAKVRRWRSGQPVRRQFILPHQLLECCDDRIGSAADRARNCRAGAGRSQAKYGLVGSISTGFSRQHIGIEPESRALAHQPHAKEVAELQQCPVAPGAVGFGRTQPFGESVRQDRLGLGIADAIGQACDGIEAVDRDLVTGGDLRAQTCLPQPVERPCQKVTISGSKTRSRSKTRDQAQARSVLAFSS